MSHHGSKPWHRSRTVRDVRGARRRLAGHRRRSADRAPRAVAAAASRRCCASSPASRRPTAGIVWLGDRDVTHVPPQQRGIGFVFQHYAPFKHMTVCDNVAFGLTIRKRPKDEIERKGRRAAGAGPDRPVRATDTRASSRAASASAWRSPARWRWSRRCCCSTSPSVRSMRGCARSCASWLRRLHDETHVTTVFVTHDQEEAMDVADSIVVMDHGKIEQDRRAARAVRAPRQRVRDELHRAGQPPRCARGSGRTTSTSCSSPTENGRRGA